MFSSLRSLFGSKPIKTEGTRRAADGMQPEAVIDLTEEVDPIVKLLVDENNVPYKCPICLEPPEEPVAPVCGHIFCNECLTGALELFKRCPMCNRSTHSFIRLYTYRPSNIVSNA
ncbi:uncharacterized protein LOC108023899 [Drosophila biarmipes]|uniref:uncharacterized protein LOC108023899 n=1 Tax=Drosophila biarmipes TaxID=125945 RepID=UPI0007E6570A|nr:uncharacterized protein LOC108023899 [Drosophila biarmipes]